jgi:phage terminase large subunit
MKREFPTTPDEALSVSVEGTYYGPQIARAEIEGRIGHFPPDHHYAVNTAWDIGIGDATAIWFYQFLSDSGRLRFLYYYEMTGEGAEHYARKIRQLATEHRWPAYGYHFLPQDVAVREWGTNKTRVEQLIELGIPPSRVPRHEVDDGINAVRMNFGHFEFDEHGCSDGLRHCGPIARNGTRNAGAGRTSRGMTGLPMGGCVALLRDGVA